MTPQQKKLARHALGLDNTDARGRSYRNRYFAPIIGGDTVEWHKMKDAGLAEITSGPNPFFYLTIDGARAALNKGERLCPEDFPENAKSVA